MATLFDYLTLEEKKLVNRVNLKKDEILFHENDLCLEVGIVINGIISISSFSYQGIEMNYNTLTRGGVFGNNLIFSSEPYHKGNVIAKTKSEVILIKKEILIKLLQTNKAFLIAYLSIQSNFGKSLNNKIKTLSFNSAKDRLLFYLSSHNNMVKIKSVTILATDLNLSREATSRLISSLKKDNIISYNNRIIKLN